MSLDGVYNLCLLPSERHQFSGTHYLEAFKRRLAFKLEFLPVHSI